MTITSSNSLQDPLKVEGNRASLPFPYLRVFYHNGYPGRNPKSVEGMGGWFSGAAEFEADLAAMNIDKHLQFHGPEDWQDAKGQKTYKVYWTRALGVAPIGSRVRWSKFTNPNTGKTSNSSHTEILAYLAELDSEKNMIPWGPAVLSATSFSGNFLLDALKAFVAQTAEIRKTEAPGVSSAFFYAPIGTFGDKRITKLVGKGEQSPVVPCQTLKIDWTPELLAKHYVGPEVESEMVTLHDLAAEWLAEKSSDKAETTQEINNSKALPRSAVDDILAQSDIDPDDAFA